MAHATSPLVPPDRDPAIFAIDGDDYIEVVSYDPRARVFEIQTPDDPMVEKAYTTAENLAKAIHLLNLDLLKQHPAEIVGHDFDLDADLVMLFDDQVAARRAHPPH